jgi:peroxiredoxin
VHVAAQQPVDTSKIGPPVGAAAPAFSGPDQDGRIRSLASAAGPKGTMLVFFRSADW